MAKLTIRWGLDSGTPIAMTVAKSIQGSKNVARINLGRVFDSDEQQHWLPALDVAARQPDFIAATDSTEKHGFVRINGSWFVARFNASSRDKSDRFELTEIGSLIPISAAAAKDKPKAGALPRVEICHQFYEIVGPKTRQQQEQQGILVEAIRLLGVDKASGWGLDAVRQRFKPVKEPESVIPLRTASRTNALAAVLL